MTTRAYGSRQPYRWRKLSPDREASIRAAAMQGVRAADLARQYGINIRTVYRTIERAAHLYEVVRLGEFVATFELTADGPLQTGPWYAVAEP